MTIRAGTYIVPTHRWYIERTVWLIAGVVLVASTALALLCEPAGDSRGHGDRAFLHQRRADRVLPGGQCAALVRLHADARIGNPDALESLFSCRSIAGILSDEFILRSASTFPSRRSWCWPLAPGGRCSRSSSAAPWCGSPRPAIASWRMRFIGSAPSHGSIRKPCRQADAPIAPCRPCASAIRVQRPRE